MRKFKHTVLIVLKRVNKVLPKKVIKAETDWPIGNSFKKAANSATI